MVSSLKISHLLLLFVLAALPFAATFAFYYPDERHYTDGAIETVKGHGWLIPHTASGAPRLQKPPLAYWAIAASYKIFGVNVIASRLPFLIASCGTIFLTFSLARKLTGKNETALLAAILLISHPQFFLCSVRSIPDALLVFFITLSVFGFLRLIVFGESSAAAFWMAYGGAMGAMLSKGSLGLLVVGVAWAFVLVKERDWTAVRKLIHPLIFIITVILATSWFVYIFWKDPATTWSKFFGDQFTGNIHGHFWSPVFRAPLFAAILLLNFLPWSATAIEFLARRKVLESGNVPPPAKNFILVWTVILILGFSIGANISLRYMLPATPLMAILFADVLMRSEKIRLFFSVERILKIALGALALLTAILFFLQSQWPLPILLLATVCGFFLVGIISLGAASLRQKKISTAEALGISILCVSIILFYAAMPVQLPDRAQQIAKVLQQNDIGKSGAVLLIGDVKLASRVRVLLGENWTVTQADKLTPEAKFFTRVVVPEKQIYKFVGRGWKVDMIASRFIAPTPNELWRAIVSRQLPETLSRHTENLWLAARE
jgi:4-amino-4-deoxy-L-arabinose transferase-like glycosyltransferase